MFRIQGYVNDSIVDGPGLRFTVFTQGCYHNCKGCHNPQTHDINGGYEISAQEILEKIKKNPLLDGLTLSGGEPFLQAEKLIPLAKGVKDMGLNIVAYSGFLYDELIKNDDCKQLLKYCDILIDGKFILSERSLELRFKGSKNQRIIDVQKSLNSNDIVLFELN